MAADSDPTSPRVVPTEFGAVVLAAREPDDRMVASHGRSTSPDRCWRCDAVPRASLDRLGLCQACGPRLRADGGVPTETGT